MGLTKEVLSAHTQQEEQVFLDRFKDLSKLRVFDQTASSTLHCQNPAANPLSRGTNPNPLSCVYYTFIVNLVKIANIERLLLSPRSALFPGLPRRRQQHQPPARSRREETEAPGVV